MRNPATIATLATLLVLAVAPARAGDAGRLGGGLEVGAALPVEPYDFGAGWDASRGFGAFVSWRLSPTRVLVVRGERDRFPFAPGGFGSAYGPTSQVTGSDATLDELSLGVRACQSKGAVRAHAALYAGLARRAGRRTLVTFAGSPQPVEFGEPDRTTLCLDVGVGVTWVLPRLPALTAEVRSEWFGESEMAVPVRIGVAFP